mgnify:CR=1 FL=1
MDKLNQRAFDSASSALSKIEALVESVSELPERSVSSVKKTAAALSKAIKPFTVKVNLEFTVTSERKFSKLISKAVGDALADVKLRLTEGRRMRMPPDLVGRFDIPRMEEGGIVKGPNKAFDSVMALLKPGEMVVPAEVTKQLQEMAGNLRDAGGRFTKASGLSETIADVENLTKGLLTLRGALEAGLADPKDIATYNEGVALLTTRVGNLDEEVANLSYSTKVRLSPAIVQARTQLEQFREEGEAAGGVFENLFKKILGPARFLALSTALDKAQDGIRQLTAGASEVFTTLGGGEIPSFIDSLNKANKFLGLSRDRLAEVKTESFGVARAIDGVSPDELGFAIGEAAAQGIKLKDGLLELSATAAVFAKGTDAAAEKAVEFGFLWRSSMGQSQESTDALFASMARLSDETSGFNVTAGKLFEQTQKDVEVLDSVLRGMSDTARDTMVNSFNRFGAVLETNFINADNLRETLAKAFVGGPENIKEMQTASALFGGTVEEIRANFETGDIAGMMEHMADALNGMSPAQLSAFASAMNIDPTQLSKAVANAAGMEELLTKSAEGVVALGDGMLILTDRAGANRTAFEKLQERFTEFVGGFDVFGVKGVEVLDFFKEFNLSALLAVGYLGKLGVEAIGVGLKLAKGFGGVIGGLAGKLLGLGSAAGGVGAGGAVASIFAGLSTGLTTLAGSVTVLGTVLLSPPGIAFTVSFVAAIISLGAALRLAAPSIKVFGDVAIAAFGGVSDIVVSFMPVLQTLITTIGQGLIEVLHSAVAVFQSMLAVDPSHLLAIGPALFSIAGGITALAASMAALGAVQLGSTVLSLFTGGAAEGPTGFLDGLLASIANLTISAPDRIKALTATVNNLGGFVLAYARLTETVRKLPTDGFLGGLFGGADAATKLTEQVGPFLDALESVLAKTSLIQGLTQTPQVAPVAPGAIQQVIQAELSGASPEPLGEKLDVIASLLERLVGLQGTQAAAASRPEPSASPLRAPRQGSAVARDLAEGNY